MVRVRFPLAFALCGLVLVAVLTTGRAHGLLHGGWHHLHDASSPGNDQPAALDAQDSGHCALCFLTVPGGMPDPVRPEMPWVARGGVLALESTLLVGRVGSRERPRGPPATEGGPLG